MAKKKKAAKKEVKKEPVLNPFQIMMKDLEDRTIAGSLEWSHGIGGGAWTAKLEGGCVLKLGGTTLRIESKTGIKSRLATGKHCLNLLAAVRTRRELHGRQPSWVKKALGLK